MRSIRKVSFVFALLIAPALAAEPVAIEPGKISRSIIKEPKYKAEPHYSLVVIGPQATHQSWMVMDGNEILYFDRNGNGDLTEAEDRIEIDAEATKEMRLVTKQAYTAMNVFPIGIVAGVNLRLDFWVRNLGYVSTDEWEKGILHDRDVNNWENATLFRITDDAAGGVQNPILLTATTADAQITHLGGPLSFALKWGERQKLQPWPQSTIFDLNIGTPSTPARNYKHRVFAPLTEWEMPRDLHPVAVFEFPPKRAGGAPVRMFVELDQRCCGDTVYAEMAVPREAGQGKATVTVTYASWTDRTVQPTTFTLPVGSELSKDDTAVAFVIFKSNASGSLAQLHRALASEGLKFRKLAGPKMNEYLSLQLEKGQRITITLNTEPAVLETSKALGQGTAFETALTDSGARYEISIHPATLVHEQKELLSRIHSVLVAETGGTLFTTWDRQLSSSALERDKPIDNGQDSPMRRR